MSIKKDLKLFEKYFVDACLPSPPDDRDYTIESVCLSSSPLPETFCLSGMSVLNLGSVGSCVAHACATAMGYGELSGGMKNAHDFSRGFIYGNRRPTDHQGEGMFVREALKQLNKCGDCEYEVFPYNETYPEVKSRIEKDKDNLMKQAEPFKVVNYFRCYTDEEVKLALMNLGAVVISIPIYSSFSADCPLPKASDKKKGGHAMCVIGWDKTGWIIQNSWSRSWGKKGTLHLPYDYPINEFWGITVNTDVPQPKKKTLLQKVLGFIAASLRFLFAEFSRLFKK